MTKYLRFVLLLLFSILPALARALTVSDAVPDDPVLTLHYTRAEIAFERASQAIINACAPPLFGVAWILAEADRPEGRYVLLAGPIWDDDNNGQTGPVPRVLEQFGFGGIDLLTPKGACVGEAVPDNAFNNFFPDNPGNLPTAYEEKLITDMGVDLIRRAERAFGGRAGFVRAFEATGHKVDEQDPVMIPLLKKVLVNGGGAGPREAQ